MKLKLIILLSFIFILLACGVPAEIDSENKFAVNGELDLSEWNHKDELIQFNGEWLFYWKQLLEPDDFAEDTKAKSASVIDLPGTWNDQSLPGDGYATYRLQVSATELNEVIGLKIP
ncbi:serine phosphatase RsbU [Gracilibacillus boraciitolerans JCM 21714]|uniref:Serine phosphatase RsbU n=1 Tax=Gracilibacillus boraciitolerans JCM 21714 TaxID=1298598 RepID=W4VNS9_9BACI|nr:hypothetical protein [Gracilibacillus boraciitolerans]GAE94483.1 serine phosphatase RsbU [Gracilibacillus boraciitolerans JCM 21714]